ncbi:SAM-dependent methyltransferase [Croceibacter atlanticus]|uniref:HsdM family class I SAM-dependent methyltransferase n=1 Tax=Croceibacter atlanticus TaxID=313588 RepID=UPI001C6051A7|nr:N-6 DNA methylase [Croceibacter atlanticus]MBW4970793.1 SAM-dependent methyltransferase [Croceibacter atlanticus]
MRKEILKYLNEYSYNTLKIDRLIVSSFLYSNKISVIYNELILKYKINEDEKEYQVLREFLSIHKKVGFEALIELFEYVISPVDKIVTGAVFTPNYIRESIISDTFNTIEIDLETKVCDPACGCAGFLFSAAIEINKRTGRRYKDIIEQNLFGLDIQPYSAHRSQILLNLLALYNKEDVPIIKSNIFLGNALNFDWNKVLSDFVGFDIIVGNPPYVCSRNIDKQTLGLLDNWNVCSTGHPDLYIPFFELGLHFLRDNGVLGFITVNSFYKSVNGRALRRYFQENKYDFRIIDFGDIQIFKNKSTYTCICLIQKTKGNLQYTKLKNDKQLVKSSFLFQSIKYGSLNWEDGWNLQNSKLINKLESTGRPLGKSFKTRNGIATLKNNIFVFNPIDEDDDFFYLQNGKVYPIERGICTEIVNPNKLTKLDSIESIRQQAILPYSRDENKVELINEDVFKLNFPNAYAYLTDKKTILAKRDKGNGNYEKWFAYGRNQSLEKYNFKMFFPHITPDIPNFVINQEKELLFYNGLALIGESERELSFIKKIMSSRLFWFYITNSSKPYGSGYFSLSRNYIKNFGIYDFSEEEIDSIINEQDKNKLNRFIESKYEIELS